MIVELFFPLQEPLSQHLHVICISAVPCEILQFPGVIFPIEQLGRP